MSEGKLTWNGYVVGSTGYWLLSNEKKIVPIGTTRFLAGKIMYAFLFFPRRKRFSKSWDIWWKPVENCEWTDLEKWRATL